MTTGPIRPPLLGELETAVMSYLWDGGDGDAKAVHVALGKRRGITLKHVLTTEPAEASVGNGRKTRWSYEKMWAWWALAAGHVTTSRRHAIKALRMCPLQPESWLLLWCAIRGY